MTHNYTVSDLWGACGECETGGPRVLCDGCSLCRTHHYILYPESLSERVAGIRERMRSPEMKRLQTLVSEANARFNLPSDMLARADSSRLYGAHVKVCGAILYPKSSAEIVAAIRKAEGE